MKEAKDFGEENVVGPNDNVVRMMTIHSSKGLEFPFVIYSGLSKDFNKRDLKQPVILNQQFGLEWDYFDVDKEMAFPSLASVAYIKLLPKRTCVRRNAISLCSINKSEKNNFI